HPPAQPVVVDRPKLVSAVELLADEHLVRVEALADLHEVRTLRGPHHGVRHLVHHALALSEVPSEASARVDLLAEKASERGDLLRLPVALRICLTHRRRHRCLVGHGSSNSMLRSRSPIPQAFPATPPASAPSAIQTPQWRAALPW